MKDYSNEFKPSKEILFCFCIIDKKAYFIKKFVSNDVKQGSSFFKIDYCITNGNIII